MHRRENAFKSNCFGPSIERLAANHAAAAQPIDFVLAQPELAQHLRRMLAEPRRRQLGIDARADMNAFETQGRFIQSRYGEERIDG